MLKKNLQIKFLSKPCDGIWPHDHGEIIYGGTRPIEDDRSATFSEYIFLFPACLMISHWLTKNAELNSVF